MWLYHGATQNKTQYYNLVHILKLRSWEKLHKRRCGCDTFLKKWEVLNPNQMRIYCDSQSCMAMAKHVEFHEHCEHTEVWVHIIEEKVETREIESRYCPTNVMVMDIIASRSLPYPKLGFCKQNLELSHSTPTEAIDEFFKEQMFK